MNNQNASSMSVSESFRKRADSACFYEAWVASVLGRAGMFTVHHPFTIAKHGSDIESYAHTWDLDVGTHNPKNGYDGLPVEVKSLNLAFNIPEDYPYDKVLLCSQQSFMKKWPGASETRRDFLMVSRLTGAILWVPQFSSVEFGVHVVDKSRNEAYKAVGLPAENLMSLDSFIEHARQWCSSNIGALDDEEVLSR